MPEQNKEQLETELEKAKSQAYDCIVLKEQSDQALAQANRRVNELQKQLEETNKKEA